MYPKVKVRDHDADYHHPAVEAEERSYLGCLKAFDSLSTHDFSSPVKEYQEDYPPTIARVPSSYIPNFGETVPPKSKGRGNSQKQVHGCERENIRASSIPRPRAVLSSPDNDAVIGSKEKIKAKRHPVSKVHSLIQTRHEQGQPIPKQNSIESPIRTRRESKVTAKSREKKGSEVEAVSSQRKAACLRKGKVNSAEIGVIGRLSLDK